MYTKLTVNGVDLPSPTKISFSKEQLWNSKTGRSVKTGKMLGAVIGEKTTLEVEWTLVTASEFKEIVNNLPTGFFGPVKYQTSGDSSIKTLSKAYHGTITYEDRGYIGSTRYYGSVKTTLIEQ